MMTQEKTTALIWLNYPKAGWLAIEDGKAIGFFNHLHDYVNYIYIANENTNSQAWKEILDYIGGEDVQNITINMPSRSSANSNPSFPDKLPDPPVEELSLIQAFAYPDPPVTYVNNPSDTDKPELFPDEDLRISEALAYGYHTTNIKGNPQSTVTTAGGPVEVRKEYGRSKVNIGILE